MALYSWIRFWMLEVFSKVTARSSLWPFSGSRLVHLARHQLCSLRIRMKFTFARWGSLEAEKETHILPGFGRAHCSARHLSSIEWEQIVRCSRSRPWISHEKERNGPTSRTSNALDWPNNLPQQREYTRTLQSGSLCRDSDRKFYREMTNLSSIPYTAEDVESQYPFLGWLRVV